MHADALIEQAYLLHRLGRREESLSSADRAVLGAPADLNALNTRGMILDDLGRHSEALADFDKILSIDPDHADALTNRGIGCARRGQFHLALECYERSLSIKPDQPNAIYNRAVIRLVLGDWIRGFREFESRWGIFPHEAKRLTRLAPVWSGQADVRGRTLLLHHEQGYGDTLQFARYVPLVARLGARVIVAAPSALCKLIQTLPGSPRVVSEGEPIPPHDYHCPLMSLPLAFGTTPNTVPAEIPYLRADSERVQAWNSRLGARARPRIGLVWSGRRVPPINHARDMTLDAVCPLFDLNADFICLHTELSDSERSRLTAWRNVTWPGKDLVDFADTAALLENLDLLITVDSAVAHLGGALGKPVWVMNRYASCWRWLLDRSDSPWYPSLRLFRQHALGDWAGVVADVLQAGRAFLAGTKVTTQGAADPAVLARNRTPADTLALLQKALELHNQGQLTQAVDEYRRVLARQPRQADALHYLGVALAQLRQFQAALDPLSQALEIQPDNADLHNHYGHVLAGLARHEQAIASYDRAIVCNGGQAGSHYNRGVAFMEMGRPDAALECYMRAIELDPDYAEAHNNRGNVLSDLRRGAEALTAYECAIAARHTFASAWINKSQLLRRLHRYEAALGSAERALTCEPRHPEAHNSRGAVLADMGRYAEALASYERAIELDPSLTEALWNKGLVKLSCGELREGWALYESRWGVKSLKMARRFPEKSQWLGATPVGGKTVLLHSEQGYGDTIQFSRYCALLAARGARVILSVPTALQSLLSTLEGAHDVVGQTAAPQFDFHCPLMSLPLAFGTDLGGIPAPRLYLRADKFAVERWAVRLGAPARSPRVGIAWSGRSTHRNDFNRSIPLEQLLAVTRDHAESISLQRQLTAADEACLARNCAIRRLGEELTDFADTAALMANLDLVITVDTAIAHLAGALGKPVWILLPYVADWRWLQDREDSPWYPSARLFRQGAARDWAPVIERVRGEFQSSPYFARYSP